MTSLSTHALLCNYFHYYVIMGSGVKPHVKVDSKWYMKTCLPPIQLMRSAVGSTIKGKYTGYQTPHKVDELQGGMPTKG